jgi:flagellar hook-basal body complex protein FliE
MIDPTAIEAARARLQVFQSQWDRMEAQWQHLRDGETGAAEGASFGALFGQALGRVSEVQDRASEYAAAFMRGESIELHQVTASAEEAGIALELLAELRNKVLDAYHTLVNMQS